MNCLSVTGSENNPQLVTRSAPDPRPGPGEVLIQVRAAGLTPTELHWSPTWQQKSGEERKNAVPGHEFSGIVAAVGGGIDSLKQGDQVFGMNDWYSDGAMADFCVALPSALAFKPTRLSHEEAASVPIGALTAWQALFDHANLQSGELVLIQGGAGSVGMFAVQFARQRGARVVATASARNIDFVSHLGADQVIDYHSSNFEDSVKQADVVFDCVGGETLNRSWNVLAPGGRLVTVAGSVEGSTDPRVTKAFFIVEPDQKQLEQIAALLEQGTLRTLVDAIVPLSRAADAYGGKLERQGRGKIVVAIAPA
jgi:NADPH:quinone reductase-like Zn-dependent oxidoreductase